MKNQEKKSEAKISAAGESLAGGSLNGESLAGRNLTGGSLAGESLIGETISDKREEGLKEILGYYSSMTSPSSQENIVSMLQEIQELYGCITPEHSAMAAEAAGVKETVIDCIMKLYKSLKPAPYRHRLTVCTGKNCHREDKDFLDTIKKELGIKGKIPSSGALSSDKKILLETRDCLKQCRTAPNFLLDGRLYAGSGNGDVKKLIKTLKAEQ